MIGGQWEVWMKRFAMVLMVAFAGGVGSLSAQTPGAATTSPQRYPWYAELAAAATLGHTGSSSVGVEAGYSFTDEWQLFVESGRMGNVASADLDLRAQTIANFIRGSASTAQRAVYFDVGLKYRTWPVGKTHPYVLMGVGTAGVKTSASFFVNGTDVTAQLPELGVLLGTDLSGSLTKPFLTIGGGFTMPLTSRYPRYLVDVSYRYGRIFPKSSEIENDLGINTQRAQVGIGIRF